METPEQSLAYARAAAYRVIHACRCGGQRSDCMVCSCALEALENAAVDAASASSRARALEEAAREVVRFRAEGQIGATTATGQLALDKLAALAAGGSARPHRESRGVT